MNAPTHAEDRLADLEARLTAVEDKEAIRAAIYRYARGIDRADVSDATALYWEDGALQFGNGMQSADQLADTVRDIENILDATQHMIGNISIDLRGDVALTETYAVSYHRTHPNRTSNEAVLGADWIDTNGGADRAHALLLGIRYLDRFEKRDGRWCAACRRIVLDWSDVRPPSALIAQGFAGLTPLRGAHGPTDPLYTQPEWQTD